MQQNILRQSIYPKNYNSKLIHYKLALKQKFKQKNNPVLRPNQSTFYQKFNQNLSSYRIHHGSTEQDKHNLQFHSSSLLNTYSLSIQRAPLFQKPQSPKAKTNNKLKLSLNRTYTQCYDDNLNKFRLRISSMRNIQSATESQKKYFISNIGSGKRSFQNKDYNGSQIKKKRSYSASNGISTKNQSRKLSSQHINQVFCYKEGWNTSNNQEQQFQYL